MQQFRKLFSRVNLNIYTEIGIKMHHIFDHPPNTHTKKTHKEHTQRTYTKNIHKEHTQRTQTKNTHIEHV